MATEQRKIGVYSGEEIKVIAISFTIDAMQLNLRIVKCMDCLVESSVRGNPILALISLGKPRPENVAIGVLRVPGNDLAGHRDDRLARVAGYASS